MYLSRRPMSMIRSTPNEAGVRQLDRIHCPVCPQGSPPAHPPPPLQALDLFSFVFFVLFFGGGWLLWCFGFFVFGWICSKG